MLHLSKLNALRLICKQETALSSLTGKFFLQSSSSYLGKWEVPTGYETGVTIYNSSVGKQVPLILKNKNVATWYVCGPTVYDESHIGHASCYVKFDVIRRILENIFGINITLLMGITDIDDKIIKRSAELGMSATNLSRKYEIEFFNDMSALHVKPPSLVQRVTDCIHKIISFCEELIAKKYAYVTDQGNVYFKVSKAISSDVHFDESQASIDPSKKDHRDFALWKAAKPEEPSWPSPWGNGRPGWHIECSVIASEAFGSDLDLHSGGYDLLFPHHSNEKSQSEAYHSCSQWGNYWIHSGLLQVQEDVKMSKSLKNTISIKDFLKENCVNEFRIMCLQSAYRKNISYCSETLAGAKGLHKKFHNFINDVDCHISNGIKLSSSDNIELLCRLNLTKEKVVSHFADDFNTFQALICLSSFVDDVSVTMSCAKSISKSSNTISALYASADYVNQTLKLLGVHILNKKILDRHFVYFIDAVVQFRNQIRLTALGIRKNDNNTTLSQFIKDSHSTFVESTEIIPTHIDSQVMVQLRLTADLMCDKTLQIISKTSENVDEELEKELFHVCDELRSSASEYGITIKDYKETSSWFPAVTFCMR